MPEAMHSLVSDAKRSRFSSMPNLSEEEIIHVWDAVSEYIEFQMCTQRGVNIPNFGTFTFTHKKMEIGNNKFILVQRPVFVLSEKYAQTHALQHSKYYTTGEIPVVQLNYTAIAVESMFDRDTVETCVREVLQALSRAVANQQNVEFLFRGIGVLSIKEYKVKMKFFKDFLNSMDGTGHLMRAMENEVFSVSSVIVDDNPSRNCDRGSRRLQRPGTAASVMSNQTTLSAQRRPGTNTVTLPKLNGSRDLLPPITEHHVNEGDGDKMDLPPSRISNRELMRPHEVVGVGLNAEELREVTPDGEGSREFPNRKMSPPKPTTRSIKIAPSSPKPSPTPPKSSSSPRKDDPISPNPGLQETLETAYHVDTPHKSGSSEKGLSRPVSAPLKSPDVPNRAIHDPRPVKSEIANCLSPKHHHKSGQDLCYLCMQRAMRNIPVSFDEERKRKEHEQDALLQQYQQMKDHEAMLIIKANQNVNRQINQKNAAFNLGVAEGIREVKNTRSAEPVKSYLFQNRPLTPLRFYKQEEYGKALESQVKLRQSRETRERSDREFQERLEQVQLAEDLAAQREHFLRVKADQVSQYQRALSAQLERKRQLDKEEEDEEGVVLRLSIPKPKILKPFEVTESSRILGSRQRKIRSRPLPMPKAEPDSKQPVFGSHDATNEKLLDNKERSRSLLQSQLNMVSHKKKIAIMEQLTKQKEEAEMLHRTKQELIADRLAAHKRAHDMRFSLEKNWREHHRNKLDRENEERLRLHTPGMLLLQQTDKYRRCGQCTRKTANCGESNIWSESRYVPGSRLMV